MASEESEIELSGRSWVSEEPEISWGNDDAMDQEAGGPEEEIDGLEEEAGPSSAAYSRGRWRGSDVTEAEIEWLYRSRRIPEGVTCRIPKGELEPVVRPGERVVFTAHFERGFGLPASDFFWRFLNFYKLQPHHLPGNAIFYLSSFVSFMEGYVGIWPTTETFARFYNLRINSIQDPKLPLPKPVVQCGACIITPRQKSPYYKLSGFESCWKWQQTFFYVKNSGPVDLINLPAYVPGEPARTNWQYNPGDGHEETNRIIRYLKKLKRDTDLCADDIVRTFIWRRVLPLQRRAHKICQMSGRFDPTRITTFWLSKADMVAKAKQICKTKMPVEWKWGLQPYSRRHPSSPHNFARISAEVPESYTPSCTEEDKEDPDPFRTSTLHATASSHNMGSGNSSAFPSSRPRADESGSEEDDCVILEVLDPLLISYAFSAMPVSADPGRLVLEHATPLSAEVGDPPASRVRKASAPEAGSSGAPASKRQKVISSGPPRKKKRNAIPTSSGAPLELTRSSPGMRREAAKDTGETQETPQQSPARSGAGKTPSPPREPTASAGNAAPENEDHRAEGDFSSPPEFEDLGASNTGAGSDQTGRSEPLVPPVLEKTTEAPSASPTRTSSSAPSKPASPAKGPAVPPPASLKKPPPAPFGKKVSSRRSTAITVEQLSGAVEATAAQPTGSQALTLHAGRAAIAAGEKVSAQLGRIVELNRGEANLGALQWYVDKWNTSDMTETTLGVGKDRNVVIDTRGPRNTVQHLVRLKHAVREFDNAWHDANNNVLLLCRKLLWTTWSAKSLHLKAGLQHAGALKEAIAAGEAKVEEAKKQLADAQDQLRQELEEERKLRKLEQERNNELSAVQASIGQMVQDVDDKARKLFPDSQARAEATVAKVRIENPAPDASPPWTTEDYLAALYSRISHMRIIDRHLAHLPDAAIKAFKCLWPEEPVPDNISSIADRLLDTGKRLSEWRHSAARAGADTALRFVCSWYESLDLSTLNTMRGNAPTDTDPAKTAARRDRAYRIACYASTSTFIPPPADLEEEFTDDEEEAADGEEEEAEGDAPEEPAAGNDEQAPEEPVTTEQAPESSSPLYQ
ncbi:hypothetical protein ACQ4PT_019952 [Festuca glaucescens]